MPRVFCIAGITGKNQPLSEVAYACGFRRYIHFACRFHPRFGFSPGAATGDMLVLATQ
jgi:AraC-like DNA-binding protein